MAKDPLLDPLPGVLPAFAGDQRDLFENVCELHAFVQDPPAEALPEGIVGACGFLGDPQVLNLFLHQGAHLVGEDDFPLLPAAGFQRREQALRDILAPSVRPGAAGKRDERQFHPQFPVKGVPYVPCHGEKVGFAQQVDLREEDHDPGGVSCQIPQEGDVLLRYRLVHADGDQRRGGPGEPLHRHLRVVAKGASQPGCVEEPGVGIPAERGKVDGHLDNGLAVFRVFLFRNEVRQFGDTDDLFPPVREPHACLFPFPEAKDGEHGGHGDRSYRQDVLPHDTVQEGTLPRLEPAQNGDVDDAVLPETLPARLDLRVEALQTVVVPDLDEPLQEPFRIFLSYHHIVRHDARELLLHHDGP